MFGYLRLQLHFLLVGLRELLARPPAPVPPPRLRHRVHGSTEVRGYLEVGQACWASVEALLREAARPPESFRSILDFGCGSGRLVRCIPRGPSAERTVTGVDIDRAAIAWCRRHLAGSAFLSVEPRPPLPFTDSSFDLAIAVSVFTHLDEAMQFAWLAELRRVLRPGGILIASVHGDHHRALQRREVDLARGFAFVPGRTGIFKRDGLPDFYQDAQHTAAYVRETWSRYFRIVDYRERGMAGHQDAIVAERIGAR